MRAAEFLRADAPPLPFANGRAFDLVLASSIYSHLIEPSPRRALRDEALRV